MHIESRNKRRENTTLFFFSQFSFTFRSFSVPRILFVRPFALLSPDLSSLMAVFHFMLIVFVFPAVPPPPIFGYFLISSLGLFNSYSPHLCTNQSIFLMLFHSFFCLYVLSILIANCIYNCLVYR